MSFTLPSGSDMSTNNTVSDFMNMTARLNDYNEITSLNQYVLNNNTIEYEKLEAIYNTISSQLLKLRQEYLLYDGSISKYKLWITVINISIITISICFFIIAISISKFSDSDSIFSQRKAAWLCIIIAIIYTIIIMLLFMSQKNRRTYSWTQFYWNQPSKNDINN